MHGAIAEDAGSDLKKMCCGFKDQARARLRGEKCGLSHWCDVARGMKVYHDLPGQRTIYMGQESVGSGFVGTTII
jgi:hypothetical protein